MTERVTGVRRGGGRPRLLNPEHIAALEKVKADFEAQRPIEWAVVEEMIANGTSQGSIARVTGIDQSWISRKLRHFRGASFASMDASKRGPADD